MNKYFIRLMTIVFSSLVLVACGTTSQKSDEVGGGASVEDRSGVSGKADNESASMSPLDDPSSPLSQRVIYFDFDSNDIKPEFRGILEAHARYLADSGNESVELAGHCDERGTREYNLALGERRAKAISRAMSVLGVSDNQLYAVSYGEEQPAESGNSEFAWQKNRRVEIIYRNR
uniref:Peptidoglycan-associated lipoprotein n=1 Tax=Candidatus Kentrum sp. SD TaxID=2126332 RepID=A0A450YCA3_9GAMM|nr:MAG: peptidoglycan-associated lipoprotein [Candidatus Kentron sp. SD]VFK39797.1 MAG: peptidoglycan-associated lipoprotein [Candidatus Kentron sp. SD]VFK78824.1 MAG: peptidoglycan-associated lipoprotein [Candidatus Kentron sp. SD]